MDRFYLSKEFARLARRAGVDDEAMQSAITRAEQGTIDADLGGNLIKQRVARPNQGRSGGFRTVLAYRRGKRAVFLHLFDKGRQSNLTSIEQDRYRSIAEAIDALSNEQLDELVAIRGWRKIERSP